LSILERQFAAAENSHVHAALSTTDVQALADCSREILSVLDAPTEEWAQRVTTRAMALLRAERMFIVLPAHNGFSLHFSDPEMRHAAAEYQAHFHAADVWTGPRRKALGIDVYSHHMLLQPGDERSEFWNDYILAHRLYQPAGLSCDVDHCPVPASLIAYKRAVSSRPFGDRELTLLRALQPSFAAAVGAFCKLQTTARELSSCVDALAVPVLLIGSQGLMHANTAFTRTLGTAAGVTASVVTSSVQKALREWNGTGGGCVAGTVAVAGRRSIAWSLSVLSSLGRGPLALVQFHVAPTVRVTEAMREQLGLTPRQAAVAQLMADGRTYREVASVLEIRPNTARRHWEQVLHRLGVHSRHDVRDALSRSLIPHPSAR
jgi:DNA-binding CsgD family transcriptional regulator